MYAGTIQPRARSSGGKQRLGGISAAKGRVWAVTVPAHGTAVYKFTFLQDA